MKKLLLTLLVATLAITQGSALTFEWGTATWNIEDGTVFDGIDELNEKGIVLSFTNPADYALTFLNVLAVDFDLYIDDAEEAVKAVTTAQGSTDVPFKYNFVEGHKYKIVTTDATLVQANLATYQTDTLTSTAISYSLTFTVKGPELVKTIEVEGTQALTIVDQNEQLTYSLIDVPAVLEALGIESISEAQVYGLNVNGSYNAYFGPDYYDGWRDADGEYTIWSGGWDGVAGHNAYPAVYSIKLSEGADSVYYYFYDYWTEYDPDESSETGSSGVVDASRLLAPETSYNSVVWDWDNGDGTTTQYSRRYRTDEGKDYKASFVIIANKKYVLINATLHFVSQEDYAALQAGSSQTFQGFVAIGTALPQQPGVNVAGVTTQEQSVTIEETDEEGLVNITFSGFTAVLPPVSTSELTLTAKTETAADGSISYSSEPTIVNLSMGPMVANYQASVKGVQASAGATPVLVLTLQQTSIITAVFGATAEEATAALNNEYATVTGIASAQVAATSTEVYGINGTRQQHVQKGLNLVKQADGSIRKVLVK